MPTNPMSDEHRLLHYLLVWVIMPRNHNHGVVMNDDLVIMRALCSDVKINWSYFIAHHMAKIKDGPTTSGLSYVILWTRIFKYFNIDLSNTLQKGLKGPNCINYATLHQMGCGLAQVGEQPQQDHQEAQAGPSEQPSEQPSMNDMMQVLLRIEQNKKNMENRLERIERNQTRMIRKIQRTEAYTFSEDEGDDDDDDQD
ncbi:hypothetical protein PIB30_086540 [Stylosanthes scabra]|uniref:Uncharacterized protein n=1 Tax=Stylosanthes scabra TaxID=79078 RepID=A0ABU6TTX1_9FABA|nr:hypothetical protein [Stylosanthes scabra]